LTKKIPNQWTDKDELIRIILFEMIVNFVESEEGVYDMDFTKDLENKWVSQEYVDGVEARNQKIRDIYDYIKIERPRLEKCMIDSCPDIGDFGSLAAHMRQADYSEAIRYDKLVEDSDDAALKGIIELRGYLWT